MLRRLISLSVLGLLTASLAVLIAQPPPKPPAQLQGYPPEEEEKIPPRPQRRVVVEEEGPPPVTVPYGCYYVRMEDLARAAADAKNPAIKALLARYVVAFDRILAADDAVTRVCPLPMISSDVKFPAIFGGFPLNDKNEPRRVNTFERTRLKKIEPYEVLLANEADRLLNPPKTDRQPSDDADAAERALAAEQLMSAALRFYDSARDLSKRRGTAWDKVQAETVAKLAEVRLARLRLAAERKDWATVRTLGERMVNLYTGNIKLLEEVFAARLAEGIVAARSEQLSDLERARELLVEFESRFPGSKNSAAEQVRTGLKQQTERLFKRAEQAVKAEDKEATRLLRTLEALDPNYPGLRDLQSQLKTGYAIITVGVNRLPKHMSPYTARSDADLMAMELLFESLVEGIPDETLGTRYRPGLAATFPTISSGARNVRLVRPVDWAGLTQQYEDASDVAGTIRLLKGKYRSTWQAAGADWLIDQPRVENQNSLRIAFSGNHPYPLALLTFKILPTRWLAKEGLLPDDAKFSLHPYGTGPYKAQAGPDGQITSFVANPNYGRRPGKSGQPFIKEIRFVDVSKKLNLAAEFKTEQLHILTDVPTADLPKYSSPASGLIGRVQVVDKPSQNRRVWMLAVNHRRPTMQSVALRRGLAHAIDRESILTQVFRAGRSEYHKPLAGPFPADSWAVPRLGAAPPSLFDRDLAAAKFKEHNRTGGTTIIRLAIPAEDPRARLAAEMIKRQVESASASAEGKVTIEIDALGFDEFDRAVYREASFDLAYIPVDYPDDWYPFGLAALLDPTAATPGGRNIGAYLDKQSNITPEDQKLARQLIEIRRHADYTGKLVPMSHDLQRRFLDAMPFVPLWQLDRHTVISSKLKIVFDDDGAAVSPKLLPPSLFTQVGRWKLD